jgi:hypothetical protein
MLRNFDTEILDLATGQPQLANERVNLEKIVVDGVTRFMVKDPQVLTLKLAVINAFGNIMDRDKGISAENVVKAFGIVTKIRKGGDVEIDVDEAALINERVRALYNILIAGQIAAILSKDPEPAKAAEAPTA